MPCTMLQDEEGANDQSHVDWDLIDVSYELQSS